MNEYTQHRIVDRFLTPRYSFTELNDAVLALKGFPGGRIESYNYVQGVWITHPIRG